MIQPVHVAPIRFSATDEPKKAIAVSPKLEEVNIKGCGPNGEDMTGPEFLKWFADSFNQKLAQHNALPWYKRLLNGTPKAILPKEMSTLSTPSDEQMQAIGKGFWELKDCKMIKIHHYQGYMLTEAGREKLKELNTKA